MTAPNNRERILPRLIDDEIKESFITYSMSVIVSRALPDVRDGLKPVHRRVLYAMDEAGLQPNRPRLKCARVVGDVMGNYHPHGDQAIYDTLVPEAHPESDNPVDLEVLDRLGRPVRASLLFHSGEHPTLRLRTREGYELTGTTNHPVLCLENVAGVPMPFWKLLEEIRPGQRVLISRTPRPVEVELSQPDWQLAFLMGAFVSEGWASATRAGFNNIDREFFQDFVEAYDAVVGGTRYVYERRIASGSLLFELDIHDTRPFRASVLASLVGVPSAERRVPEVVWQGSQAFKRVFLQALF